MLLVEKAIMPPGCCVLSNTADGPFIDTLREDQFGNRLYVSVAYARELGLFAGLLAESERDARDREINELKDELVRLRLESEELHRLRDAVRYTLTQGAVVKPGPLGGPSEDIRLRPKPGQKGVAV